MKHTVTRPSGIRGQISTERDSKRPRSKQWKAEWSDSDSPIVYEVFDKTEATSLETLLEELECLAGRIQFVLEDSKAGQLR